MGIVCLDPEGTVGSRRSTDAFEKQFLTFLRLQSFNVVPHIVVTR